MNSNIILIFIASIFCSSFSSYAQSKLYYFGSESKDLFFLMHNNQMHFTRIDALDKTSISKMPERSALLVVADGYPEERTFITHDLYKEIEKKSIRLYIEYPKYFPNQKGVNDSVHIGTLERAVVASGFFGKRLPQMSILGINDCHIISTEHPSPILVYAKVAGFDKAEYGLTDTDVFPLLFKENNILISTTALSNFERSRFSPYQSWEIVWENILGWLTEKENLAVKKWAHDPRPTFSESEIMGEGARLSSIQKGSDWFYNSRLLLHPSWKDEWLAYQGDGKDPFGPPINKDKLIGDGSIGILEGHASTIHADGAQQYRYWIRYDVQAEVAFALAAAGNLLGNEKFSHTSEKLIDFLFYNSKSRELTSDKAQGTYGLLGWADTHPYVIYADDNARAVLGAIGASAYLQNERWNQLIVENILANFRTTSRQGAQGRWRNTKDIAKNGWEHYFHADLVRPHPHFESWMWACYLWLYDKTGYKPLLDKAKTGIKLTMEAYPDKWKWTNGIQQERARMVLPLAWLLHVEDTSEHKKWLTTVADDLLKAQQRNGALREELGDASLGSYGRSKTNSDYGTTEAPLIFQNGDEVADMLYTNNFAFFALNEAAQVTGFDRYREAVEKLSGFLTRIQVTSKEHSDLDGAWFRAFDYGRWDYWASNADAGWGAWCTLSGWIQSWIVGTQVLIEEENSLWDLTKKIDVKEEFDKSLWMLNNEEHN